MQSLRPIIIFIALLVATYSCSTDSVDSKPTDPLTYKALINVSYGEAEKQVYDIYLPENRTTQSRVMILIHGGGWKEGDKTEMNDFRDYIRQQFPDVVVVNMNYRLADSSHAPYPMQIHDISTVVAHLKEKQDEYQIGSEIGILGISAGGHLALLWSYAFAKDTQIKMVCSIVGPTNLADEAYLNSEDQNLKDLISQFGEDIDLLKEISPLFRVKASAPPTLLFYGAQDPLIPTSQGTSLKNKLTELNVVHEFTLYPNGGHGWVGLDLFDTSLKLKAFMKFHL